VSGKLIQGYAALYDVRHWYWKNERFEVFLPGAFDGSLWGVWLCRDHRFTERKIAEQEDQSLELLSTSVGLAFRAKLKPGDVEWIDGRSEVSVSYLPKETETRNGVHVIKKAALLEVSLCHIATLRETHATICDAANCGTLREDAATRFGTDAAGTKFMDALRRLQS
jgi:HK97 family phage prohead protease